MDQWFEEVASTKKWPSFFNWVFIVATLYFLYFAALWFGLKYGFLFFTKKQKNDDGNG